MTEGGEEKERGGTRGGGEGEEGEGEMREGEEKDVRWVRQ